MPGWFRQTSGFVCGALARVRCATSCLTFVLALPDLRGGGPIRPGKSKISQASREQRFADVRAGSLQHEFFGGHGGYAF